MAAAIRFLGIGQDPRAPPEARMAVDEPRAAANIAKVTTPILILMGDDDSLLPVNRAFHDRLEKAGKVRADGDLRARP